MLEKFEVETEEEKQLIDITENIQGHTPKKSNGVAVIFTTHTTAAIVITETGENLEKDIFDFLDQISPQNPPAHSHGDPSHTSSHIFSALFGQSRTIPVENGQLSLGTWQKICLLELSGPRKRTVTVVYHEAS